MNYHGGPVLRSNTAYVIYWQPTGSPTGVSAFPTGYTSFIDSYFANVAAADGSLGNVYGVATQYSDGAAFVGYGITAGTAIHDTDPLPPSNQWCNDPALPGNACITDLQIQHEIDTVIAAQGLPRGAGPIYFLVTPPGLASCGDPSLGCYDSTYCAYHSDFNSGSGETLYANIAYAGVSGCTTASEPNNTTGDDAVNVISHEQIETMTDPEGSATGTVNGWYHDANSQFDPNAGYEIADLCATYYGAQTGSTSFGGYNQTIGSGNYALQTEWSNADNACIQGQPQPAVSLTPVAPVYAGQAVALSASSDEPVTYHWNFGDGATADGDAAQTHSYAAPGAYTVTVTGTNNNTQVSSRPASETVTVLSTHPNPGFSVGPSAPTAGQAATFDGSGSTDTGGAPITSWSWSFGDGTTATGSPKLVHTYSSSGTFLVRLTITDSTGQSAATSEMILVQPPPASTQPKKAAAVELKNLVVSGVRLRILLTKGLPITVHCSGSCHAAVRLLLRVSARKGHRASTKLVDVGHVSGQAAADGTLHLTLKLTAKGRARVKHARHPALTVVVDAAGAELKQTIHPR